MRVVITGANRGIGLGLVRAYVAHGDEVVATARQPEAAGDLRALGADAGDRLVIHKLDVTRDEDAQALGRALEGRPVHLLFNNAGVGEKWAELEELRMEDAIRTFDTNALGPLRVTRALRRSLATAHGKIINITSTMGSLADNRSGRAYAYRMSKAALNMATRNLALELGPEGVMAIAVNPGWVKTDMGGAQATTPVEESVATLVALAERIGPGDSGKFFHAKGYELPW